MYQENKSRFMEDVRRDVIAEKVADYILNRVGRKTPPSEFESWRNSAQFVRNAIDIDSIPDDCGIAVEYQIPATSKRVDYIVSGTDDEGADNIVIIELKQWSSAEKTSLDATVSAFVGGGMRHLAHPSYRAWSYARLIEDFNEYVYENDVGIHPCAFLHNYPARGGAIYDDFYREHLNRAPVFCKAEGDMLGEFIARHIRKGDSGRLLYEIEHGTIRPSKKLVEALASMLRGNDEFVMIDDQKIVYETVLDCARQSGDRKQVIIVEGGPGTGKSVVAINLLVALSAQRKTCHYVTRNAAPREVYQAKLTGTMTKTQFANLFKGAGAYIDTPENSLDSLVVDEAHRLNEKSGMYRKGENQIMEIIRAASTSVFFVDPLQKVTLLDIGSVEEIEQHALRQQANVVKMELPSQFRCNGSDGYLAWVENTLGIRETANPTLEGVDYDFRLFDSPLLMYEEIRRLNSAGHLCRMLAGYCWDWVSKSNPLAYDIEFPEHDFRMRWNDFNLGQGWIMHEESAGQVGCIHTSQGLEVDYAGIIIGPDLRIENGEIVTDPYTHPSRDRNLQGFKSMMKKDPEATAAKTDALIRNTYRTLLTRGMKGCFVFCTDSALAEHFRRARLISPA